MKKFILYLWQLPQNLAGWFTVRALHACYLEYDDVGDFYATPKIRASVSLGEYVIIKTPTGELFKTMRHERGHQKQSLYLGWLYLPIIGVCSGLHNLLFTEGKRSYYDFWTERWADRLGGVKR